MRSFILFCVVLVGAVSTLFAQRTLIHCGILIDGKSSALKSRITLVVEGEMITDIQSGFVEGDTSDTVIDLSNQTVLPGLMDMHVHIEGQSSPTTYIDRFRMNPADVAYRAMGYAKTTLMAGFTTVRDLGGSGVNISLRNAITAGLTPGPRIYTCGKAIGTTGGHADPTNGVRKDLMGDPGPVEGVINGPADAMKAVRQRYKDGADVIKITATGGVLSVAKDGKRPQFHQEEIEAIVKTAKDYDMISAAHAHGAEGMKRAVLAGITSIEHGTLMTEEVMDLMIARGTYYVPTISAGKAAAANGAKPGYFPPMVAKKAREIGPQIQATFEKAYARGVKIAFGTDAAVYPHGENAQEFIYMVEGGMPAMEAIQSATRVPAEMLNIADKVGTLEKGKWADIIAVEGNPLQDITVMQQVAFVMKGGVVYKE